MNTHASQYTEKCIPAGTGTASTPSGIVEYGFYFYMCYTLLGGAVGLWVSNLGSALLILLVFFCLWEVGSQIKPLIRAVAFPLGCGIAYAFIQLVLHEQSLEGSVRPFLIWMLTLVLVQSLAMRTNFLHRFCLVVFFIGLAALPYISYETGEDQRATLGRGIGFNNSNSMGEWYGFCAVYFVVLAFTSRKNALRILSWPIAIGCLYVVTLTVSRGALLAAAIAIVVASRHLLKKGFLPVLLVVCIGSMVVALGVFDRSAAVYSKRGTEDTGRMTVWPLIIDSFLDSPLTGIGHSNVGAIPEGKYLKVNPHNGFLYLAQSSGVVPLALFIAYWLRSGRAVFQADVGKEPDTAFYLPLLTFTFITVNLSGLTFMTFLAIVSLAIPMTASIQRQDLALPSQLNRGTAGFKIAK